jgi:5-(carboxyamino)imidazole ribonucleotide synthase
MITPVPPGGTIGILGGGQLGRMLALAAARLGLKVHIYSDEADAPAFQVVAAKTFARYDDANALDAFALACDAITFEFENVPAATVEILAKRKPMFPDARALAITQDRLAEKRFVAGLGLKTAPFAAVDSPRDAETAIASTGTPAILKTRRYGYDGKGQAKISNPADIAAAFRQFKDAPCILEGFVDFSYEASVIAARGRDGSFAAYDPPENFHADHILRRSTVPSRLTHAQSDEAKAMAKRIADAFDYVGVLAVELFVGKDGALLVNEIAPRVHNSGSEVRALIGPWVSCAAAPPDKGSQRAF